MVTFKSPQMQKIPSYLGTGMRGVAQWLSSTLVITPAASRCSISHAKASLIPNGTDRGWKTSVTLVPSLLGGLRVSVQFIAPRETHLPE